MKETLKKWVEEKRNVKVICISKEEPIEGKLLFADEKAIHLQVEYGLKDIVPWKKIATIKDLSGEIEVLKSIKNLPLVRVNFLGVERTITHGLLEKMDENYGIVTVYHDGVRSIHPMSSIKLISFISENYED